MRRLSIVVVITLLAATALAQTSSLATGSWRYAGGETERAKMQKAVDVSVDSMSFVMRPFARPKLKEVCAPWKKLRIEQKGDLVTVATEKGELTSPLGKTVVRVFDGDEMKVRREITDGVLTATAWTDEGGRTNIFRKTGDKMVVESKVFSEKLPKPVVFTYTYE
jgi:hypothetical protein